MAGKQLNLYQAAEKGDLETVKRLIESQPGLVDKLDRQDSWGKTAIMFAARAGHFEVVEWLIEKGNAKVFQDGSRNTILHDAAASGNVKLFAYLVEKTKLPVHKVPDFIDRWGIKPNMPLMWAVNANQAEMVNFILDNYPLSAEEKNKIFSEVFTSNQSTGSVVKNFMKLLFPRFFKELDFEQAKRLGVHYSLLGVINKLEKMLVENKLTPEEADIITRYGAELNLPNPAWEGDTLLHRAIKEKNNEWIDRLLIAGVNPDIPNGKGVTARMLALNSQDAVLMNALFPLFDMWHAHEEYLRLEDLIEKSWVKLDKIQVEKRANLRQKIAELYSLARNIVTDINSIPEQYRQKIHYMLGFSLAPLDLKDQPLPAIDPLNAYQHLRNIPHTNAAFKDVRKTMYYLLLNDIDLVPGPNSTDPKKPVLKKGVLGVEIQPGVGLGLGGELESTQQTQGEGAVRTGVEKLKAKIKEVRGLDESDDEEEALKPRDVAERKHLGETQRVGERQLVGEKKTEMESQIAESKERGESQVQAKAQARTRAEAQDDLAVFENIFSSKPVDSDEQIRLATLEEMMVCMIDSGLTQEYEAAGNTVMQRNIEEYLYGIGGWAKQEIAIDKDNPNAPKSNEPKSNAPKSGAEIYAEMRQFGLLKNSAGFLDTLRKSKMILDMQARDKAREAELLATIAALRGERLRVGGGREANAGGPEGQVVVSEQLGAAGRRSYLPGFTTEPKNEPKKEDQEKGEKPKTDNKP